VPVLYRDYDMGIILVPPINFNYENGLPNKLFDCIQARLGMAAGPLKEIATITSRYNIGVVSEDFTAAGMAKAIQALNKERVSEFKMNADRAAKEMNATFNKKILLEALSRLD
jgi:hypothetical protein